jgi:hypothetical protein
MDNEQAAMNQGTVFFLLMGAALGFFAAFAATTTPTGGP